MVRARRECRDVPRLEEQGCGVADEEHVSKEGCSSVRDRDPLLNGVKSFPFDADGIGVRSDATNMGRETLCANGSIDAHNGISGSAIDHQEAGRFETPLSRVIPVSHAVECKHGRDNQKEYNEGEIDGATNPEWHK